MAYDVISQLPSRRALSSGAHYVIERQHLATRLEWTPEEMLYFDDDASYGASAREVGLSAYQVGGAAGVRPGLTAHGLQRG
jgi:hypothetical protein